MHTAFRITNGEPGASYHQRSRMYRYQPGNRQKEEKKTAAGRNSNDFLMGRILPIAPDYYMENAGEEKINLTTRESFDYLYRSALNYTGIIGSGLPFRKKKASPRINIINLYKALENILPNTSIWKYETAGCTSVCTGSISGRNPDCSGYRWTSRRNYRDSSEG